MKEKYNGVLFGKKLLILGGTTLMNHVVKEAKSMGVHTIVTDKDPQSPAKQYADKAYNISTGDIESIIKMAQEERIDGIFAGYDDFNTSIAVEISERLGLNFYANKEQIDITKDKYLFKNLCRQFDVPVVKEYELGSEKYPCVVKPVDSYSAKGITICNNKQELLNAIEYAIQFSKSKRYIIEKYMDASFADCVNIDYVISDGKIVLSAVGDKKVIRQENKAPLTSAVFYPSKHIEDYVNNVDKYVKAMFSTLNMKNGTVFIESFFDKNNGFAIYEMGYRVGGGQSSILLDYLFGVDYIKMLINHTLTGKMCIANEMNLLSPYIDKVACGLVLLAKPGKIEKIKGMDEIISIPEVINITQYLHEGDEVAGKFLGTLGQTFARIHLVCENAVEMNELIKTINKLLIVRNSMGENMLVINQPIY